MSKPKSLSVLIVTRNRKDDLMDCINSLEKQTSLPNEVIIIENNSTKTLKKTLKQYNKFPIHYYLEKQVNISKARNKSISKATGDVLIFTDDDCLLEKNFINNLRQTFKSTSHKTITGVLGTTINLYKNNRYASLEQQIYEAWFSQYLSTEKVSSLSSGMFINTRCFAIRKRVLDNHNLQFNNLSPHKIEDTEFGIRLFNTINLTKNKIIYDPKIKVFHKNSQSILELMKRSYYSSSGKRWLLQQYPDFEKQAKIVNTDSFDDLGKKSKSAKLLMFCQRRITDLIYVKDEFKNIIKLFNIKQLT